MANLNFDTPAHRCCGPCPQPEYLDHPLVSAIKCAYLKALAARYLDPADAITTTNFVDDLNFQFTEWRALSPWITVLQVVSASTVMAQGYVTIKATVTYQVTGMHMPLTIELP